MEWERIIIGGLLAAVVGGVRWIVGIDRKVNAVSVSLADMKEQIIRSNADLWTKADETGKALSDSTVKLAEVATELKGIIRRKEK